MTAKKNNRKPKELRVVFDASALYTGSESDLVNQQTYTLINKHRDHQDLQITWYIPEVAKHERQYQMQTRALELLPSLQKNRASSWP